MTMRYRHGVVTMSLMASAVALAFCLAAGAAAQEPLSLEHFDGWEMWPLVEPGDLHPDNAGLVPIRIELDGLFPGPNGFGVPPLEGLTMYMDVTESSFHGNPALWVQWTSKPPPGSPGAPALDVLLVDRETFRLLFRIAGSARGDWAGRYELIQAPPDRVVQVTVGEDGETTKNVLASSASHFDFAAYPFLLPFLDLREGMGWRLSGYDYLEKKGEVLAVRVVGRTSLTDAGGVEHDVWQVDVMPAHGATLISFYVSEKPPYFYGWDYRLTRDGSTALKLTLRGWTPMAIG